MPAEMLKHTADVAAGKAAGHLRLVIEGLKLLHPGAVYRVYLDLPAGTKPDPAGPYYVGNIALFGEGGEHGAEASRSFDVTAKVRALMRQGKWSGPLHVTIVRGNPGGAGAPKEPGAFVRFTRVKLIEH